MLKSIVLLNGTPRILDNPALKKAIIESADVIPLFATRNIQNEINVNRNKWDSASLKSLNSTLDKKGFQLLVRSGDISQIVIKESREYKVKDVYWTKTLDETWNTKFRSLIKSENLNSIMSEDYDEKFIPSTNNVFKTFSSFWKQFQLIEETFQIDLDQGNNLLEGIACNSLDLDNIKNASGEWIPGEIGALNKLSKFIKGNSHFYINSKNRIDLNITSMLSPHINRGEISFARAFFSMKGDSAFIKSQWNYEVCRQLAWRIFTKYIHKLHPRLDKISIDQRFEEIAWNTNMLDLQSWKYGLTGFPIVDAGMRELITTGWISNRVRLVTASFLVKHLLFHWSFGAKWFLDHLLDADISANYFNWQWVTGCGIESSPYFRIFNPIIQGKKFDPDGIYVKKWIPELAALPAEYIHNPWEAPKRLLDENSVILGKTYPYPIIEHKNGRERALYEYSKHLKKK
jgi:deoxyribodipyrimidine photo-lyase|tara:strand:- start:2779 stop:4155 length:1377 start_codon:yes stop_codon:yes gene_type:complete